MDCRSFKVERMPYDGAAGVTDPAPILGVLSENFALVEIDPSSAIDDCIISSAEGERVCAVGAPVPGPFTPPVLVKPYSRLVPWDTGVSNYLTSQLRNALPALALRCHRHTPPAVQRRRAPLKLRNKGFVTGGAGALQYILEIPIGGRKRCTVRIQNGAAATTTWSIYGVDYLDSSAGSGGGSIEGAPLGAAPSGFVTALILDSATGATTTTLTTASQQKVFTLVDESYDSLLISVTDDAVARTVSAWATAEDE